MSNTKLPVAPAPCRECPFRRKSIPGYLGGGDHGLAAEYLQLAHSDTNVPCHMSPGFQTDDSRRMRPCSGIAHYRNHVCKKPRDPTAQAACNSVGKDTVEVFALPTEFLEHHDTDINRSMNPRP